MSLNSEKLAYFGGKPIIKKKFKPYVVIGSNEIRAVSKVIKSGVLTGFAGRWSKDFFGGPRVLKFESYLKKFYKVKHAIVVNSWSSGLIAAVGALKINPGDEIIVSPWTFCATATAILHWNAIPVFVDICEDTFCIDPDKIKKKITKKTRAIISPDIFGHPSNLNKLKKVIKGKNIKLITDSAHAPYSFYKGKITGTKSDIGGFSLNDQKHITTGEGGIVVTNNDFFANRIRLLRNHAEAVVGGKKEKNISNMIGFNFRMGEIEAAIGLEQYKKLKSLVKKREKIFSFLTKKLSKLPAIKTPKIEKGCTHNYFIYPIVLDLKKIKIKRSYLVKLLEAEGIQGLWPGYYNLHLTPVYQKKIAYGNKGFPWSKYNNSINYKKGTCPVAEKLQDKNFLGIKAIMFDLNKNDIIKIYKAFFKVWKFLKLI